MTRGRVRGTECARDGCRNVTRDPSGNCWRHTRVRASYGMTPFTGPPLPGSELTLSSPYYDSSRYRSFTADVSSLADAYDVDVASDVRALGVYEGSGEPSSAVDVFGDRDGIESLARSLARGYSQTAVRVIYRPGSGEHTSYAFKLPRGESPEDALAVLRQAGVAGARITDGTLEVADAKRLGPRTLAVLESFYGAADQQPCEVVRVFKDGPVESVR